MTGVNYYTILLVGDSKSQAESLNAPWDNHMAGCKKLLSGEGNKLQEERNKVSVYVWGAGADSGKELVPLMLSSTPLRWPPVIPISWYPYLCVIPSP